MQLAFDNTHPRGIDFWDEEYNTITPQAIPTLRNK